MRYTRMRDYLSRHARDMRNPYGSRGGYVVSDRRGGGRDYEHNSMGDMAYNREYSPMGYDRGYSGYDYAQSGGNNQYGGQSNRDSGNYGGDMNYGYPPVTRSGYFNYNTYGGDYNYDMRGGRRDYASGGEDYKLSPTEIRKWDAELKKEGATYTIDQIRQVAQQHGIRFDEFSPELLTAVANMMHTDYKSVVNGDVGMFVKMAKAFLCDDDFDGTPEEKAYLYYNAIVNKDDD